VLQGMMISNASRVRLLKLSGAPPINGLGRVHCTGINPDGHRQGSGLEPACIISKVGLHILTVTVEPRRSYIKEEQRTTFSE
jgi:hypothetical protein